MPDPNRDRDRLGLLLRSVEEAERAQHRARMQSLLWTCGAVALAVVFVVLVTVAVLSKVSP